MYKLIKGMLPVSPGLSPDDRAGMIGYVTAASVSVLSVAFHVALLKICRESVKILVIGKYGLCFSTKKICVPQTDQCKNDRKVFVKRCFSPSGI